MWQACLSFAVMVVCVAGCPGDSSTPDSKGSTDRQIAVEATCGPGTCSGGCCAGATCVIPPNDAHCGTGGVACDDCAARGQSCGATGCKAGCSYESGCGDSTKYCDVGKCVACPAGRLNCDGPGHCECEGSCAGASCRGVTSCDYYDTSVCGGDTKQWCWQNACTSCSSGFNCNKTKGCECDAAGCSGNECAGKCLGGECP